MASPVDLTTIASLEQQLYAAALEMHTLEQAIPAESRPDNITIEFAPEEDQVTITCTLESILSVVNGEATFAVQTYL